MARSPILNVPNILSFIRVLLVPAFVAALIFMRDIAIWGIVVSAVLYGLTALTDMLDGKIARKYGLVTDFGKFMDPLADKLLVFGAMFGLLVTNREDAVFCKVFVWVTFLIILRELAVTSMRLVVSSAEGIVIAANIWGKLKTVSQIAGIIIIILEPIFWSGNIASYVMMGVMVITTMFSGFSYFKAYWPYINSNK